MSPLIAIAWLVLFSVLTREGRSAVDDQPTATLPVCGSLSLVQRLAAHEAYWVRERHAYYSSCKFIHARYNCSRFGSTSASDYKIEFSDESSDIATAAAAVRCRVPNVKELSQILMHRLSQPLRIFMIGDSHIMQIFQSLLCMFQDVVSDVDVFVSKRDITADLDFDKVTYHSYSEAEECHAVKYKDYDNFYLETSSTKTAGRCQLSHGPGQTSCFKIPSTGSDASQNLHASGNINHHTICASYVRPLTGGEAVVAGLDVGLAKIDLSLQDFSVVFANSYMSSSDMGSFLRDVNFQGRLFILPRYPEANQTGFQYTSYKIWPSTGYYTHESYLLRREIETFCSTVNKIYSPTRVGSASHSPVCNYLDYTNLVAQRSADAKSSIFPMTYRDKNHRIKVCQDNPDSVNLCIGKDYRVCSKATLPCHHESHFCLPGPTDELASLVLVAAISETDFIY